MPADGRGREEGQCGGDDQPEDTAAESDRIDVQMWSAPGLPAAAAAADQQRQQLEGVIPALKAEVKQEARRSSKRKRPPQSSEPDSNKKERSEEGSVGTRTPKPGDRVECRFPPPGGKGWEAGTVTRSAADGGFWVKYDGEGKEWNEKVHLKRKSTWRFVGEPAVLLRLPAAAGPGGSQRSRRKTPLTLTTGCALATSPAAEIHEMVDLTSDDVAPAAAAAPQNQEAVGSNWFHVNTFIDKVIGEPRTNRGFGPFLRHCLVTIGWSDVLAYLDASNSTAI